MSINFDYTRNELENTAQRALELAKNIGATDAAIDISESNGLSVASRNSEVETIEHNRDKSLSITVYLGQQRGHASTSDFTEDALKSTVQAAYDIARFTAADDCAGLAAAHQLFRATGQEVDLDVYHPWEIGTAEAIALTLEAEAAAFDHHAEIQNSDGAHLSTHQGQYISAASNGFMNGTRYSRHSVSVVPIAVRGEQMERDHWYLSSRSPDDLRDVASIGRIAAERTIARLGAKKISSRSCPVLFEAPLACGILGNFAQAISGGALYRKISFLNDALGKTIFPEHIRITDDPFIPRGMGSGYFDDEGVATARRDLIDAGVLTGYLLSVYTARKLGMSPTGNAGGSHNLSLTSNRTTAADDLPAMLRRLGTGLLVTELMGSGVNYVTGDYSRGASGFWVEEGIIVHPVQEITIAGNLQDLFAQIVAVGADVMTRGSKQTGSILFEQMTVSG